MQLSVIPHLTIYGDVKPEQLRKTFLQANMERVGLIGASRSQSTELMEVSSKRQELMTKVETITKRSNMGRNDLMIASGQVGLNKPYRAPVYQSY